LEDILKGLDDIKGKILRKDVPKAIKVQRIIAIIVVLVIAGAFAFAYIRYGGTIYKTFCDKDNLQAFLAQFDGFDKLVFVAIRAFQTVVKIIPAEPLEIASGAFYGTVGGMLLCLLGSFIGGLIIILITRKIGRKVINLFVPIEIIDDFEIFKDKERMYTGIFFIYLIPSSPKDLLVYAAALTDINIWKFLIITTIARIPNIIMSTWCGAELINENYGVAIAIFAISGILAIALSVVYKKVIAKQKKSREG
jgi:uncharacterized membrane protein YdjX (TVP38/TMEM64 family)